MTVIVIAMMKFVIKVNNSMALQTVASNKKK